ncbi:DNA-binding protein [Lysobacteraceae bacterium NML07-0707]|nr:DNA-binding protein [Xanthomonadaceae bacterium NML07-0707]
MLTVKEVAARLRVSASTLLNMRKEGSGPTFVHVGRSVRYPAASLESWLAERLAARHNAA